MRTHVRNDSNNFSVSQSAGTAFRSSARSVWSVGVWAQKIAAGLKYSGDIYMLSSCYCLCSKPGLRTLLRPSRMRTLSARGWKCVGVCGGHGIDAFAGKRWPSVKYFSAPSGGDDTTSRQVKTAARGPTREKSSIFRGWVPEDEEFVSKLDKKNYTIKNRGLVSSIWQMGRPWSASIKAGTALLGCGLVLGYDGMNDVDQLSPCMALVSSIWLHSFAVYTLDDYWDREPDRINHPERPLPQGRILPSQARTASIALFAASTVAAMTTGSLCCSIFMLANNALYACYTPICRYSKVAANISIVFWNIMPWIAVGSVYGFSGPSAESLIWPALFMLPPTIAREIVFDWKDRDGDATEGLRTLATMFGKPTVFRTAYTGIGLWAIGTLYLTGQLIIPMPELNDAAGFLSLSDNQTIDVSRSCLFVGWNMIHMMTSII